MKISINKMARIVAILARSCRARSSARRPASLLFAVASLGVPLAATAQEPFVSGLEGSLGSTIGPDNALYVTESAAGRVSRIDLATGDVTPFATGLPATIPAVGLGGAMDVVFSGETAYVLVSLVGPVLGGTDVEGIYRIDGPDSYTVIADIGTWAINNPPPTAFDLPNGVQYAIELYRNDFIVTDGHHNRVLQVDYGGKNAGRVRTMHQFGNVAPTGLETWGQYIFMAEAGAVPHAPEDGKIKMFGRSSKELRIAAGAPLLVDVEFGEGRRLYALAQGDFPPAPYPPAGSPALPNTGSLVEANIETGKFDVIADGLNLPSSLEVVGDTMYVVTLTGDVWRFQGATPW